MISAEMNRISVLALVACDASYNPTLVAGSSALETYRDSNPEVDYFPTRLADQAGIQWHVNVVTNEVAFDGWQVKKVSTDPATGFGAVVSYNATTNEYIVALTGTNGLNAQDWYSNTHLGITQWDTLAAEDLMSFIIDETTDENGVMLGSKIHFTGQSLGGALAQYAAHDYANALGTNFDSENVSLTTFNGLGAVEGLTQRGSQPGQPPFNPTLLADVKTAHYFTTNDLVSRLGGANLNQAGNSYKFDFPFFEDGHFTNEYPWVVNAHRVESGFYRGFEKKGIGFYQAEAALPNFLTLTDTQKLASAFGGLFNNGSQEPTEAFCRFVAGAIFSVNQAPKEQLQELLTAFGQHTSMAGYKAIGSLLSSSITLGALKSLSGSSVAHRSATILVLAVGLLDAGRDKGNHEGFSVTSAEAINRIIALSPTGSISETLTANVFTQQDSDNLRFAIKAGFYLATGLIPGVSNSAELFNRLNLDPVAMISRLFTSVNWMKETISDFTQAAIREGENAALVATQIAKGLYQIATEIPGLVENKALEITDAVQDAMKGAANAYNDFLVDHADPLFAWGEAVTFDVLNKLQKAFTTELNDTTFSYSKEFFDNLAKAQSIIEQAGQQIIILAGRPNNPFNVNGYNPETQPLPTSDIKEGNIKNFTIYIPYAAAEIGQRIKLKLEGADANQFKLLIDGNETNLVNGEIDLTVLKGRRDLTFGVWSKDDTDVDSAFSLKATLLDQNGVATHTTHLEANLNLDGYVEPASYQLIAGTNLNDDDGATGEHGATLKTNAVSQEIQALGGNDRIEIFNNDARAYGGDGNDNIQIKASVQQAKLYGGLGTDTIVGENNADTIYGDADNDWLAGGTGEDIIIGGDGADQILGGGNLSFVSLEGDAADVLQGGAGNDIIWGGEGADTLMGEADNDQMVGDSEGDVLYGGSGDDTLYGETTFDPDNSTIPFTLGQFHGQDLLDGGDGVDYLEGGGEEDTLIGGLGNDILVGDNSDLEEQYHGKDHLDGGDGADKLYGYGKDDELFGGAGDDELEGDASTVAANLHGNDYLDGEAGEDILIGDGGSDELFGGEDDDELYGDSDTIPVANQGNDYLDGESGNDYIRAYGGNDQLFGGEGNDELLAEAGDDLLDGEAGEDILDAGSGKDILYGGADDDQLFAGTEDDQLFGGTGADILVGEAGNDTLQGDTGSDSLFGEAGDDIYIVNAGDGNDALEDNQGVNKVKFGAGITPANLQVSLADGADGAKYLLIQYGATDSIAIKNGFNGNSIKLYEFADGTVLTHTELVNNASIQAYNFTGDSTAETLAGSAQNDILSALGGDDVIQGGGGNDTAFGGTGNDTIIGGAGSDNLRGEDGNDILRGDLGNDTLRGGEGNDSYILNASFGSDLLEESDITGTSSDTIQFGPGISPDNITVSRSGEDLLLSVQNTTDQLRIQNFFFNNSSKVEQITFADSDTVWDVTALNQMILAAAGTPDNDEIYGFDTNDTLDGKGGNDYLEGGLGNDTYLINLNEGSDMISEDNLDIPENIDTVKFGVGILPTDVIVTRNSGDDLVMTIQSTGQELLIDNFFSTIGSRYKIERVEFTNGTVWDLPTLRGFVENGTANNDNLIGYNDNNDVIDGLAGDDRLQGLAGNDTLQGNTGRDRLEGGSGNDTLDGGTGRDTLLGMDGNDTYVINRSSGTDFITETFSAETDSIQLAADILPADVTLYRYGGSLLLNVSGSNVQTVVQSFFDGAQIEEIKFANGTTWNLTDINARVITPVANAMTGTAGNDIFTVDDAGDTITEAANAGTDTVNSKVNYTLPTNVENINLIGPFANFATGNALNNVITGNDGDDTLDGAAGADTLIGKEGDDFYYVDNVADVVTENANEGTDTIFSTVNTTLSAHVENLTLFGSGFINATGNDLNNTLTGNIRDNRMDGGLGADTLKGATGSDTYVIDNAGDVIVENFNEGSNDTVEASISYTLSNNVEHLTLSGSANLNATGNTLTNLLTGNSGNNIITGDAGFDQIEGLSGNDTLIGGIDGDTYVFSLGDGEDTIQENETSAVMDSVVFRAPITSNHVSLDQVGDDLVIQYSASDKITVKDWFISEDHRIERIVFEIDGTIWDAQTIDGILSGIITGTSGDDILNGTGNDETLLGLGGNDTLDGKAGADNMQGGTGNDTYFVDNVGDVVTENASEGTDTVNSMITYTLGANLENLTLNGTAAINAIGNSLNNTLQGNSGNNRLDGGTGTDTMRGGGGDDTYVVNVAGETITENANEGTDTVESAVTYTLGSNVENLILTGTSAINGTGNSLNNTLQGNSAVNTLSGGTGNDTYIISSGDIVTENSSAGTDTVIADFTYTLGSNLENLTLAGTGNINGTGNSSANTIIGNSGNNSINGGSGADSMRGGLGNDTYTVDNTSDAIVENANEGTDSVNSSVTYTLSANVENITLSGTSAINATGNTSDNVITGNSAINTLTGGAGNDTLDGLGGNDALRGGTGDDTYIFGTGDTITENANEGTDTVRTGATFTLGSNLENLVLTGTTAINGTGNTLNNVITGNSANNILTGNAGNDTLNGNGGTDTLRGGTGDDIYFVDGTSDIVTENASEGTDTVNSSVTLTLGSNVENLNLSGTGAINGTGNTLNNVINGNSGNNVLTGNAGADTLAGGAGTDTLNGGTGNDIYKLGRGDGADTVIDNDTTSGNQDKAQFGTNITREQLWLQQLGNNLKISIIGTADSMTIQDFYSGPQHQVERIETFDGHALLASQAHNLVQAMASFAPPPMGQTTLPPEYEADLLPVIAANWT